MCIWRFRNAGSRYFYHRFAAHIETRASKVGFEPPPLIGRRGAPSCSTERAPRPLGAAGARLGCAHSPPARAPAATAPSSRRRRRRREKAHPDLSCSEAKTGPSGEFDGSSRSPTRARARSRSPAPASRYQPRSSRGRARASPHQVPGRWKGRRGGAGVPRRRAWVLWGGGAREPAAKQGGVRPIDSLRFAN